MPVNVPLQAVPNQSFTVNLSGVVFDITIRYCAGIMAMSLTINGVDTIDNIRCVAGSPVIPSQYQENGNFLFITSNFQLPIYTQFNVSQSLVYFSAAELAAYRIPLPVPFSLANLNPIAPAPLRMIPQNYAS